MIWNCMNWVLMAGLNTNRHLGQTREVGGQTRSQLATLISLPPTLQNFNRDHFYTDLLKNQSEPLPSVLKLLSRAVWQCWNLFKILELKTQSCNPVTVGSVPHDQIKELYCALSFKKSYLNASEGLHLWINTRLMQCYRSARLFLIILILKNNKQLEKCSQRSSFFLYIC